MASRSKRTLIAQQTVVILDTGSYTVSTGRVLDVSSAIKNMIEGTVHFTPESFDEVIRQRDAIVDNTSSGTPPKYLVNNTTTLSAARELVDADASPVLCLNFASAKNPGGGFLSGSQAQEESLARATGLYGSINRVTQYFEANRRCSTCLYTDHMIYSPAVPVFRNDDDELISEPFLVSMLTSPAVNKGAMLNNEPDRLHEIEPTMLARIDRILAVAVVRGYRRIVLGAWGCGVFRNDPGDVANWFAAQLQSNAYRNAFDTVYFAVLDHTASGSTIAPFRGRFSLT